MHEKELDATVHDKQVLTTAEHTEEVQHFEARPEEQFPTALHRHQRFIHLLHVLCRLLFPVLILIWCPFHPALPQWHVKDPGHSAKRAGGRLHLNTPTSSTHRSRSGLTLLSRHSVET